MIPISSFLLAGWLVSVAISSAGPALRVVKAPLAGASLLNNGAFEQLRDGRAMAWQAASNGYRVAPNEGRNQSQALVCMNPADEGWFGASQTLALNRTNTAPLVVRGWSKAENVTGSTDSNYSLYADLVYADGTPLWGRTANFRCGTHDWEQREFVIVPDKPVKSVTLHCLFRGHTGKVWFDEVSVEEVVSGHGSVLFQGTVVEVPAVPRPQGALPGRQLQSRDGLRLTLADNAIVSLQSEGRELAADSPGGFLARDVAAGSHFFHFEGGSCSEAGLKVQAEHVVSSNHIAVHGRLSDATGRDRAVTLVYAVPLDATEWRWGDDIRRSRIVAGQGEFANQVSVHCGATGTQSLYPVGAVWDSRTGLALALDMARPAVYRIGYHPVLKLLYIAYDFGLVKETDRFPHSADFRFVLYRFDSCGGFRGAWHKLTQIFPDYFRVRSKEQGLWMPFTDVSKVPGWQDFEFRFHEGNNNVPWDDEHGVLSFRYTEPMTWWMPMQKEIPRTLPEALRVRDELTRGKNESRRRLAEVTRLAAMHDETGEPALLFRNEPWANGAVWSLNPNPWLGSASGDVRSGEASKVSHVLTNAATVHWNDSIRERLYGPDAKGRLDGEYLDSLEGYVTAELNFRREHFRATTVPLSFSTQTKRPALFKGLAVFEFTQWIAEDVHRLGKLMFANGVPYRFTYLCPWLDVLGTETDWLRGGEYRSVPVSALDLWRTLSGGKPYLLLMNTDYDKFTPELVEKYFQRALFYGMWPGFFSHNAAENPYWQNPRWYERDRPLFQKYIPLIKRVAETGWQPLTEAACDNDQIMVERFGPDAGGVMYFTLFNTTTAPQSGVMTIEAAALSRPSTVRPTPWLGAEPESTAGGWRVRLQPEQAAMLQFSK